MIADILAVQRIYGVPTETALSGGQVFGFHCNIADASTAFFDFSVNQHPAVTLFDTGTGNTLDLSGFSSDSQVDLRPGHFSSLRRADRQCGDRLRDGDQHDHLRGRQR